MTVGDLPDYGSRFNHDLIQCVLSSTKVQFGFHLSGSLSAIHLFECDRCLDPFSIADQIQVKLWLTPNQGLTDQDELEMIYFPDSMDEIELAGTFADLLYLSEPMKKLCADSCKGLCPQCGINLNNSNCLCNPDDSVNPWENLRSFIPKQV